MGTAAPTMGAERTLVTNDGDLRRALGLAGVTAPTRWHDIVGSTNAEAAAWARAGAPELALVAAAHQTAGRGRRGRGWEDVSGGALMFSFVLRPRGSPDGAGLLPLLAGAAMARAAAAVTGADILCKWPNDLMLGEAKVGGVLAESAVDGEAVAYVVIGIGVNLVAPEGVPGAAGLGADVDPMTLLSEFVRGFVDGYGDAGSGGGFADEVRARWRSVSGTLGRDVHATQTDGRTIGGRAVDVDERGGLVIEVGANRITVRSGEVEHVR
jgi:BirA family biotin operon repressor/biotin-[acetyl-CoA-carboxylase] ligase